MLFFPTKPTATGMTTGSFVGCFGVGGVCCRRRRVKVSFSEEKKLSKTSNSGVPACPPTGVAGQRSFCRFPEVAMGRETRFFGEEDALGGTSAQTGRSFARSRQPWRCGSHRTSLPVHRVSQSRDPFLAESLPFRAACNTCTQGQEREPPARRRRQLPLNKTLYRKTPGVLRQWSFEAALPYMRMTSAPLS